MPLSALFGAFLCRRLRRTLPLRRVFLHRREFDVEIPSSARAALKGLPAGLGTPARHRARCGVATSAVLSVWHGLSSPNARLTVVTAMRATWGAAQGGVESDVRAFRRAAFYADE